MTGFPATKQLLLSPELQRRRDGTVDTSSIFFGIFPTCQQNIFYGSGFTKKKKEKFVALNEKVVSCNKCLCARDDHLWRTRDSGPSS
jgi:hypothetical protein